MGNGIFVSTKTFSWDVVKAQSNFDKHKVSFEEAASTFEDDFAVEIFDERHSVSEKRMARIGYSALNRVLTVIFTVRRLSNGKETIRIISARQASRKERAALARFRD